MEVSILGGSQTKTQSDHSSDTSKEAKGRDQASKCKPTEPNDNQGPIRPEGKKIHLGNPPVYVSFFVEGASSFSYGGNPESHRPNNCTFLSINAMKREKLGKT